ncbi:MAG: hypothetical protein KJ622_14600 [Alphaproteobacteria bacterium]|nr:hypothetical protein [Alphaproteobacteria bacterium]
MIDTFKTSTLITLLFAALMTVVFLSTPSYAGAIDGLHSAAAMQSTATLAPMTVAGRSGPSGYAAPGGRVRKPCNGQTTSDCCKGLSKCSCLYMPGSSSNNHPTACFATK